MIELQRFKVWNLSLVELLCICPNRLNHEASVPLNKSEYCYPHWMQVHPRRRLTTPPPSPPSDFTDSSPVLDYAPGERGTTRVKILPSNTIEWPSQVTLEPLVSETSVLTVQPLRPWKCANRPAALHCKMLVGLSPGYVRYLHCTFKKALALIATLSPFCAWHQYLPDSRLHDVSNLSVLPLPTVTPSLTHVMLGSGWPFTLQ